ncbi:sugar ABC transporter permease [Paenibacillus elgii]|uniref:Carbohydrate ABC transporter permease n=1 Tax=Paenibacillus elgii TaxID=189691 RepID=A0A161SF86_9BACL|nr:carbohydrate ABC transporter permease [Paenibacillus elgii]KZE79635.1 sugar ABC transporter permease [Paenibacillus elgii]PUA37126.1 carbohydrate ABC transporter permease [Paenibacillus elgii]
MAGTSAAGKPAHGFAKALVRLFPLVWSILVIYPVLWTFFTSLKDNPQVLQGKPWDLPSPLIFENYANVWSRAHFGDYFVNSALVTTGSTLLSLAMAATTAYVLARYEFKGRGALYFIYVASMMIPTILGLIPLVFLLNTLQLSNSLLGLTLVYSVGAVGILPFGVFFLVGFYKSLPKELEEAATIDGCSYFGTFFRIMLPLSKPGLVTVAIMNALTVWNEYIMATVLINDPTKYTVPVGIAIMQGEMQYRTEWGPLFAGLAISMIPVIIAYSLFQRQITGGLTAGALKG